MTPSMKQLMEFELTIMRKLWDVREATPEKLKRLFEAKGRSLIAGTVCKMLGILGEKGYITREKRGKRISTVRPYRTSRP